MTDITPESLRALAHDISPADSGMFLSASVATEVEVALRAAADEIERLKQQIVDDEDFCHAAIQGERHD